MTPEDQPYGNRSTHKISTQSFSVPYRHTAFVNRHECIKLLGNRFTARLVSEEATFSQEIGSVFLQSLLVTSSVVTERYKLSCYLH